MPNKSIYSYSEDEFVNLSNEEIEIIITKLINLKKDYNYKNYYRLIYQRFKENNYKDQEGKISLFDELFVDEYYKSYLKTKPNQKSRRYKIERKGNLKKPKSIFGIIFRFFGDILMTLIALIGGFITLVLGFAGIYLALFCAFALLIYIFFLIISWI